MTMTNANTITNVNANTMTNININPIIGIINQVFKTIIDKIKNMGLEIEIDPINPRLWHLNNNKTIYFIRESKQSLTSLNFELPSEHPDFIILKYNNLDYIIPERLIFKNYDMYSINKTTLITIGCNYNLLMIDNVNSKNSILPTINRRTIDRRTIKRNEQYHWMNTDIQTYLDLYNVKLIKEISFKEYCQSVKYLTDNNKTLWIKKFKYKEKKYFTFSNVHNIDLIIIFSDEDTKYISFIPKDEFYISNVVNINWRTVEQYIDKDENLNCLNPEFIVKEAIAPMIVKEAIAPMIVKEAIAPMIVKEIVAPMIVEEAINENKEKDLEINWNIDILNLFEQHNIKIQTVLYECFNDNSSGRYILNTGKIVHIKKYDKSDYSIKIKKGKYNLNIFPLIIIFNNQEISFIPTSKCKYYEKFNRFCTTKRLIKIYKGKIENLKLLFNKNQSNIPLIIEEPIIIKPIIKEKEVEKMDTTSGITHVVTEFWKNEKAGISIRNTNNMFTITINGKDSDELTKEQLDHFKKIIDTIYTIK